MSFKPGTIAALVILVAMMIVPAFMLKMEPYEAAPVNEQCTVTPVDKPGPVFHPPTPKDGNKPKDPPKDGAPAADHD